MDKVKPLSNFDILKYYQKVKGFRGVFSRNVKYPIIKKGECIIVNLDEAGDAGTHWVALFNQGNQFVYFDSFGVAPPEEVKKYIGKRKCVYSSFQVQQLGSIFCGHHCLYTIDHLFKGIQFVNFMYDYYTKDLNYNDQFVYTLYSLNSKKL